MHVYSTYIFTLESRKFSFISTSIRIRPPINLLDVLRESSCVRPEGGGRGGREGGREGGGGRREGGMDGGRERWTEREGRERGREGGKIPSNV